MEIGHKRRYCMVLSEDEQRRLRNQEAGCNVPRPEVPLIVRKDMNIIAATIAYYHAALITEALGSDDTRDVQFGIGQHDVQMMIVDHDTLMFRCEVNYLGEESFPENDVVEEPACSASMDHTAENDAPSM